LKFYLSLSIFLNESFKGAVKLISSNPPCKDGIAHPARVVQTPEISTVFIKDDIYFGG